MSDEYGNIDISLCVDHKEEKVVSFCHDCDIMVCYECITDDVKHHRHHFSKIAKVAKDKRVELLEMLDDETVANDLQGYVTELGQTLETCSNLEKDITNTMCERAEKMKVHIDQHRDRQINKVREVFQNQNSPRLKIQCDLKDATQKLKKLSDERHSLKQRSDIEVINIQTSLKHKLYLTQKAAKVLPEYNVPKFVDGGEFREGLETLYGSIETESDLSSDFQERTETRDDQPDGYQIDNADLLVESKPEPPPRQLDRLWDKSVKGIYLRDETSGWLLCTDMTLLYFQSLPKDKALTRVKDHVISAAPTPDGELMIAIATTTEVYKITKDNKTIRWCDMSPFYPSYLYVSRSGQVIICMYIDNKDGRVYQTLQFDEIGKKLGPLFINTDHRVFYAKHNVQKLEEIQNQNFCIIYRSSKKNYLDMDSAKGILQQQFKGYLGADPSTNYDPTDVCCDSEGRVIVPDYQQHVVYLLDNKMKFIKLIVTPNEITYPACVAVDKGGRLWIGSGRGGVYVLSNWQD